jgi:hypothetical protein
MKHSETVEKTGKNGEKTVPKWVEKPITPSSGWF